MQTALLKIRLIQLKRIQSELGIFYSAFFLVLLAGALLIVYRQFQEMQGAFLILTGITFLVLMVHQNRADKPFVFKHLPNPRRQLLFEYLVFSLPLALPAFFSPHWYLVPLLVPAIALVLLLNTETKQTTRLPWLSRLLGPGNFEWVSGIRRAYPFLGLLLLLALVSCWLKFVPLLFLWLFTTTAASFYQQGEPLQVLLAPGRTGRQLLHSKLLAHGKLLLFFTVPALAVNSLFHPDLAWVNGLFLLLQLNLLLFAILQKYSTYSPNAGLTANAILLAVAALSVFIPFLLPLPLFLSFRNYPKALRNLNQYLA